jgi:hypothetical protein
MTNLFDGYQRTAYTATWLPSAGGSQQTAIVLFKDASETAKILEIEYDPQRAMIEYFITDFTELKTSVDAKNNEFITINDVRYGVNEIRAKYDGKTFFAHLQLV